jgi:hypothetical protein
MFQAWKVQFVCTGVMAIAGFAATTDLRLPEAAKRQDKAEVRSLIASKST